jgi:hypothetical protein
MSDICGIKVRRGQSICLFFALGLFVLVGFGCLNPFTDTYQAALTGRDYRSKLEDGLVYVVRTENVHATVSGMMADDKSLVKIGECEWTGQDFMEDQAIEQARSVGATLVIVEKQKLNSQLAYLPMTTPTVSTSNGSGSFASPAGGGSYSGYSTTYGTQTTYMPYERVTMHVKAYFLGRNRKER